MKYIIFITLLLISAAKSNCQTTISVNTSFNGFHCDGKPGICNIDNQDNRSQMNTLLILNTNKTLTFTIDRRKLSDAEQKGIIGVDPKSINNVDSYYFRIPHSYTLPSSVRNAFGTRESQLVLAKGSYLIHITKEFFKITFALN